MSDTRSNCRVCERHKKLLNDMSMSPKVKALVRGNLERHLQAKTIEYCEQWLMEHNCYECDAVHCRIQGF